MQQRTLLWWRSQVQVVSFKRNFTGFRIACNSPTRFSGSSPTKLSNCVAPLCSWTPKFQNQDLPYTMLCGDLSLTHWGPQEEGELCPPTLSPRGAVKLLIVILPRPCSSGSSSPPQGTSRLRGGPGPAFLCPLSLASMMSQLWTQELFCPLLLFTGPSLLVSSSNSPWVDFCDTRQLAASYETEGTCHLSRKAGGGTGIWVPF